MGLQRVGHDLMTEQQQKSDAQELPRWLSGKVSACQWRRHKFDPWVRKIPWRRKWQPTPVFFPEKSHGQKRLVGYSLWGHKELDMTEHDTQTASQMYWIGQKVHSGFSVHKILIISWCGLRVSLEWSFESVDWVKITLTNVGRHYPVREVPNRAKRQKKGKFTLSAWVRHLSSSTLKPQCSCFLDVQKWTQLYHQCSRSSSLQVTGHGPWDVSNSIILCMLSPFGCIQLFATSWTVTHQEPLSI